MLIYQDGHEEAQEELPKKAKFFFTAAVQNWDAEFYVKVDDNIDIGLGRTSAFFICIEYHNFLAFGLLLFIHWNSNISSTLFSTWQRDWLDFLNNGVAKIVLILDAWSQEKWLLKSMYLFLSYFVIEICLSKMALNMHLGYYFIHFPNSFNCLYQMLSSQKKKKNPHLEARNIIHTQM